MALGLPFSPPGKSNFGSSLSMRRNLFWLRLVVVFSMLPVAPSLAADKAPEATLTAAQVSQQFAELLGKRVVVRLKNGKRTSGWLCQDSAEIYQLDGKIAVREKTGGAFFIKHTDGIWKC